ncbi:hypothetical protein SNOG_01496 [Parastagonospora nodorum SN15]|uniref:FHA domain-containing protein n=1 Tax=Phaeosphaeria nodorum (strain SN15 / ATCC MYA-4574 / FGSC 10173) TaxID=321614 RepID=Q0V3B8_PHANO|nr:hypothetical protein SNOG_01496 [Parastagonospora nodorum SN15]EAT91145.2 hypothetical protein SNOG_01496 [Parastagonospora nodorum SN15]
MSDTFRVILRDVDGFEGFSSRQFDLALNAKFPIGRASKNTAKQDLMPASNNAYIDSPVISRNHAVFTAHADSGTPQVFVTDLGSMHGTMVNGERLPTHMPKQLASGDKLQFGIDVNRNEGTQPTAPSLSPSTRNSADLPSPSEFFVARKYEFEARLDREPVPFSMGFTVPDSDGEDIDGTTPRRGSQHNPLTIDDSDSESEASDSEQPDTTMMGEDFIVADDDDDEEPPTVTDIHSMRETISGAAEDTAFANQLYLDVTGGVGYSSSDDQDDDIEDFNTEASVMGDSMAAYDSDFDGRSFEPEVSIGEIVEDQPPTPESLNGMKRKADVLEEVEGITAPTISLVPEHTPTTEASLPVSGTADRDIAETAAIIASRPKKQPRSILRKINTTAKYLGIGAAGAAGALAVLSALPDAFFV